MIYHNRTPVFATEVKVDLPLVLTAGFHVLFSVFHIRCTPKKPYEQVRTPSAAVPCWVGPDTFPWKCWVSVHAGAGRRRVAAALHRRCHCRQYKVVFADTSTSALARARARER